MVVSATYDPGADSSPGWERQARESGRLFLEIPDSACLCGCKEPTPGRFRPGHDARLKGKLLRAHLAKAGATIVRDGKEQQMTARAFAKQVSSDSHDWTAALDRAVERQREAAAALRDKVMASTSKEKETIVEAQSREVAARGEVATSAS